jgi:hypothetical protein
MTSPKASGWRKTKKKKPTTTSTLVVYGYSSVHSLDHLVGSVICYKTPFICGTIFVICDKIHVICTKKKKKKKKKILP